MIYGSTFVEQQHSRPQNRLALLTARGWARGPRGTGGSGDENGATNGSTRVGLVETLLRLVEYSFNFC